MFELHETCRGSFMNNHDIPSTFSKNNKNIKSKKMYVPYYGLLFIYFNNCLKTRVIISIKINNIINTETKGENKIE
jgi:hypothetical protein